MLNTTVLFGRCSEKYVTNWINVATPIPSSVAPGAVETESKCAENKTPFDSLFVSDPLMRTSMFDPSKYDAVSPEPNVTFEVRSSSTSVYDEDSAMSETRERIYSRTTSFWCELYGCGIPAIFRFQDKQSNIGYMFRTQQTAHLM